MILSYSFISMMPLEYCIECGVVEPKIYISVFLHPIPS